jgi:hypothetical protein
MIISLQIVVELIKVPFPFRALAAEPAFSLTQCLRLDPAAAHSADFLGDDDARLLQHFQVLHYSGQGHRKRLGQLLDRRWPSDESFHDGPASRVGERVKNATDHIKPGLVRHTLNYRRRYRKSQVSP